MRRGSFSEAAGRLLGGLFAIHLGASARPVFMKAMADPTRLCIVDELANGERCVHELTGVPMSVGTWGLDLADLDADGDVDLLVIRGNGPRVYLNCGPITLVEQPSTWGRIKGLFRER